MYQLQFPIASSELIKDDFKLYGALFSQGLKRKLFNYSELFFVTDSSEADQYFAENDPEQNYEVLLEQAFNDTESVVKYDQGFMVPFPLGQDSVVVVVDGVDNYLLERSDDQWLLEMRDSIYDEFLHIKNANMDFLTALPNLNHLYHILDSSSPEADLHVMLVELYPRVRFAAQAIQHLRKATLALKNFFNEKFMIHSIGQGVFAIVTKNFPKETHSRMGKALIAWMRRENFKKVHIGMSSVLASQLYDESRSRREHILDMAWHALQVSSKRGPFSYCDYDLLINPDEHPLRKPSKELLTKMRKRWSRSSQFAVAQFQMMEEKDPSLLHDFFMGLEKDVFEFEDAALYAFLDGYNEKEATSWVEKVLSEFSKRMGLAVKVSVGIGVYPFVNFTKGEILQNCRKALLHADFFGPGSKVVFDPVSLNISGDIYFGDGDYPNAIKEYKRGLLVDPANVNLLNSLGVAYAVIENTREARKCFVKALKKERTNFMALYNLGLGDVSRGDEATALKRFEKAIDVFPEEESTLIKSDVLFQIGKLYCQTGKYKKCIDILLPWQNDHSKDANSGRAYAYLGNAYFGLKNRQEAMRWLQRALAFDTFDATSMGLLGVSYFTAGEGAEIALHLCQKSVELEPMDKKLRFYLAQVQNGCDLIEEAKRNLRKCVSHKSIKVQAAFLLGTIYEKEKKWRSARTWFSKVKNEKGIPKSMKKHITKFEEAH